MAAPPRVPSSRSFSRPGGCACLRAASPTRAFTVTGGRSEALRRGPGGRTCDSAGIHTSRSGRGRFHTTFDELDALEKPVVVAHHAPCLGGALGLSLSCDFLLAAKSARCGLPEIETIAALPGSGGVSRLARIVGPDWARWLALTATHPSRSRLPSSRGDGGR